MKDLLRASLRDISEALTGGDVTSVELVREYWRRIGEDNMQGLGLRAVVELAPEGQEGLDRERGAGNVRSVLHGAVILIKESIGTHPDMGMETTAGSLAFVGVKPPQTASVIQNLLHAGVIILGKAAMTVYGNAFSPSSISGWSPRGGQVLSPYRQGGPVGGSSTGSAVALSAGFCSTSVGCETRGSIVCPAAYAGILGLKPTSGLLPIDGTIGISESLDTLGPMGKSAWDLAAMLSSMVKPAHDYTVYTDLPHSKISNYNIQVPWNAFRADSQGDDLIERFHRCLNDLYDGGLKMSTDTLPIDDIQSFWSPAGRDSDFDGESWIGHDLTLLMLTEFYGTLNKYLTEVGGTVHNFEELHQWHLDNPDKAFHPDSTSRPQGLFDVALKLKGNMEHSAVIKSLKARDNFRKTVEECFTEKSIDALLVPGFSPAATIAATGGFPCAVFPMGLLANGDPWSVGLIAPRGREDTLIGILSAFESIFPPRSLPTLMIKSQCEA